MFTQRVETFRFLLKYVSTLSVDIYGQVFITYLHPLFEYFWAHNNEKNIVFVISTVRLENGFSK